MKNIFKKIFLLTAMTCTIAGIVFANANNTFQKQQAKGLADKNIEALLSNLSDNVELYFGSEGNVYSKTQAKIILQDYFQKRQPLTFASSLVTETANQKSETTIGKIHTTDGNVNVSILTKRNPKTSEKHIVQIRFD